VNKKALYSSLMVVVVLIGTIYLLVTLDKKFSVFTYGIGDVQSAVFKTSSDMFLLEEYLKEAAYFAFKEAVKESYKLDFKSPDFELIETEFFEDRNTFRPSHCNLRAHEPVTCYILSDKKVSSFYVPDLFSALQKRFYENFKPYVDKFNSVQNIKVPFDFEMSILNDSVFSVVSASPVFLPIVVNNLEVGKAVFRPAFKVHSGDIFYFNSFSSLFTILEEVWADCVFKDSVEQVKECVLKNLGDEYCYEVSVKGDLYLIYFAYPDVCFGLYLPLMEIIPSA